MNPELKLRHLQAADAARATLGLDLTDYVVTDAALGVDLQTADSGAAWGTIQRPDSLLRAVERLITVGKAEAIAVVARFPDDLDSAPLQQYRQGQGVDPLAGAEAVISHLVVRAFKLPCAHAPALSPLPLDAKLSPRSAAEELGYTFLPCVLAGLSQAPQFVTQAPAQANDLWAEQIDAVVIPATACGGSAVISLSQTGARIIAVADNTTTMQAPAHALGIEALRVNSYLEAIGILATHRAGISHVGLNPTLPSLNRLEDKFR